MQTFDIGPGRDIGIIKQFVVEAILNGEIPNNYDAAYDVMLKKAAELTYFPIKKLQF